MTPPRHQGRNLFQAASPREWVLIAGLLLAGLISGLIDLGSFLGIW